MAKPAKKAAKKSAAAKKAMPKKIAKPGRIQDPNQKQSKGHQRRKATLYPLWFRGFDGNLYRCTRHGSDAPSVFLHSHELA